MIKEKKPVAMYEAKEILEKIEENDKRKELKIFIKKFAGLSTEKSKKLESELEKLELIKLRKVDIIKIVDLIPENASELNKLFTETSLDADETAKILDTIKKNI